jgi:hypothetical protein
MNETLEYFLESTQILLTSFLCRLENDIRAELDLY